MVHIPISDIYPKIKNWLFFASVFTTPLGRELFPVFFCSPFKDMFSPCTNVLKAEENNQGRTEDFPSGPPSRLLLQPVSVSNSIFFRSTAPAVPARQRSGLWGLHKVRIAPVELLLPLFQLFAGFQLLPDTEAIWNCRGWRC